MFISKSKFLSGLQCSKLLWHAYNAMDASVALAATGALPENVNYAVKISLLLSFLKSVPEVAGKLKEPLMADRTFEDVVKSAHDAAVLVF